MNGSAPEPDYVEAAMAQCEAAPGAPHPSKQRARSELSPEELEERDAQVQAFNHGLSRTTCGAIVEGRWGALKLEEQQLADHQVLAIARACEVAHEDFEALNPDFVGETRTLADGTTEPMGPRHDQLDQCRLMKHGMGLGKTILGIGFIGMLLATMEHDADLAAFKALIIVPKNVLLQWGEELDEWLDLTRVYPEVAGRPYQRAQGVKNGVLLAEKQSELTAMAIRRARVVVTTPTAIQTAYKTFMYKQVVERVSQAGNLVSESRWVRGIHPDNHRRRAELDAQNLDLPPVHPLFQYIHFDQPDADPSLHSGSALYRPFSLVVVDELQNCCNPGTISGRACKPVIHAGRFRIGLTGTPVGTRPKQMAWIFGSLDCPSPALQSARTWHVRGFKETAINRAPVFEAHEKYLDCADDSNVDMPNVTYTDIGFDPFIGRMPDGSTNADDQLHHNNWVDAGVTAMQNLNDGAGEGNGEARRELDGCMFQAIARMVNYVFDPTLGRYMARGFTGTLRNQLFRRALNRPSEAVKVIYKTIRDRQQSGHPRILVYSESVTQLELLQNYLNKMSAAPDWDPALFSGSVGKVSLYNGDLTSRARRAMIRTFLGESRAVLLMSSAGQLGANVAPGCDTMIIAGDIPYNNTNLEQAVHRIRRVNQPPGTEIEAIRITARRSIITAKYDIQEDKRDRLGPAMADCNFDKFAHGKRDQRWRLNKALLEDAVRVNPDGNYVETGKMQRIRAYWQRACHAAQLRQEPLPPEPEACMMHPEILAVDLPIPPAPFPVEGYVEPDPPPNPLAERLAAARAAREAERLARLEAGEGEEAAGEPEPEPPAPDPLRYEIERTLNNDAVNRPLDIALDEEAGWIVNDGEGEEPEEDDEENPPAAAGGRGRKRGRNNDEAGSSSDAPPEKRPALQGLFAEPEPAQE
jgi:hypothetical protein